ncbi:unnamed protein product [Cuscuta epithymum]|uniref:Auxin-responsive protein n=2 Tax=Cuscuta epithymum TaxID=186058 RepID=A0AAV0DQC1_9ASTE|nr:unnamed protein product [Cuscuta epithymum]
MESSSTARNLLRFAAFSPAYYQGRKEDNSSRNIIDLGLSLGVMNNHEETNYHNPSPCENSYEELIDWQDLHPQPGNRRIKGRSVHLRKYSSAETCDEEDDDEVIESKEKRWAYVKVNMDGVIVGRKICLLHHFSYHTLALQLEDMFGKQSKRGLIRLFEEGSEFSLFYKDGDDVWKMVGDVPWEDFVDAVKRLRIVRKKQPSLFDQCYNFPN